MSFNLPTKYVNLWTEFYKSLYTLSYENQSSADVIDTIPLNPKITGKTFSHGYLLGGFPLRPGVCLYKYQLGSLYIHTVPNMSGLFNAWNTPYICNFHTSTVREYLTAHPEYQYFYTPKFHSNTDHSENLAGVYIDKNCSYKTYNDFISEYGDYLIITSIDQWLDVEGEEYSAYNPRTKPTYPIYTFPYITFSRSANVQAQREIEFTEYGDAVLGFETIASSAIHEGSYSIDPAVNWYVHARTSGRVFMGYSSEVTFDISTYGNAVKWHFPADAYNRIYMPIYKDLQEIKEYVGLTGVTYGIDEEDIEYKPTSDITSGETFGQPDNPTGGGDGEGDNTSDVIPLPDITSTPFATAGNLWALDKSEVQLISEHIWYPVITELTDLAVLFTTSEANAKAWLSCMMFPFDVYQHDTSAMSLSYVTLGVDYNTELQANLISDSYNNRFDFGSIDIKEYYGTYLDYAPYTTISIFLPYIGYQSLNVNQIMGKTLNVFYSVNIINGQCTAFILADGQIINMFSGQMGVQCIVSASDGLTQLQNAISFTTKTAVSIPAIASGFKSISSAVSAMDDISDVGSDYANTMGSNQYQQSMGNATSTSWYYAPQCAYLIIERNKTATPSNMGSITGYPTAVSGTVSSFSGFLQCDTVELNNTAGMTQSEYDNIIAQLKGGIYV